MCFTTASAHIKVTIRLSNCGNKICGIVSFITIDENVSERFVLYMYNEDFLEKLSLLLLLLLFMCFYGFGG